MLAGDQSRDKAETKPRQSSMRSSNVQGFVSMVPTLYEEEE